MHGTDYVYRRGWKDQVGGLSDDIKYCTSKQGLRQRNHVQQVSVTDAAMRELNINRRFF